MVLCEFARKCPFYNQETDNLPALAGILRGSFCYGDNLRCARYILYQRLPREDVPENILPNQREKALKFVEESTSPHSHPISDFLK